MLNSLSIEVWREILESRIPKERLEAILAGAEPTSTEKVVLVEQLNYIEKAQKVIRSKIEAEEKRREKVKADLEKSKKDRNKRRNMRNKLRRTK